MGKQEQERRRGTRDEGPERHEKRFAMHSGGGEWDCIRLPEGLEVFKPEKDETYHIDVIPYIVGKYNKASAPGKEYFELTYPVYRGLGVDEKKYIAIGDLLNAKDPVAEHFARLKKDNSKDWKTEVLPFKATKRQMMLFFVHEQADKGLQFYEGAYGTIGELMDEEIRANEETWVENFDNPDNGATLKVRFKAKSIGQANPWICASKIDFIEREEGFTADGNKKLAAQVLDKAAEICLDELLKIPTYDQLKRALDGEPETAGDVDGEEPAAKPASKGREEREPKQKVKEPEEDPEGEEAPKKAAKKPPEEDPEEEPEKPATSGKANMAEKLGIRKGCMVVHDEFGKCKVLKVAEDGKTCTLMDKEDEPHTKVDVTDVEPVGGAEEPESKGEAKATAGASKKAAGDAPSAESKAATKNVSPSKGKKDDDDWDDGWDDDKGKKGKK